MIDSAYLQILIQGGAVSLALVSLWVIYKLVTNHDNHMLEAFNKNLEALDKNTEAWLKNAEALTRLTDKL